MEKAKIEISRHHVMVDAKAIQLSPELFQIMSEKKPDIRLELEGTYLNVMSGEKLITRLGENEWMPIYQA